MAPVVATAKWSGDRRDRRRQRNALGLLEGIATTRAIRRFTPEPIPDDALATMLFAATRAPSGSNRQPFRFLVLRDGPRAQKARRLIGEGARRAWGAKRETDRYDTGSGTVATSPKARLAATMTQFVADFERIPVVVLPCLERYRDPTPTEGASIYPACQNLLLAARALGYGGVLTGWHAMVEPELRTLLDIPEHVVHGGDDRPGSPRRTARTGSSAAIARVGLRGCMGRVAGLGRRPSGHGIHPSRAAALRGIARHRNA